MGTHGVKAALAAFLVCGACGSEGPLAVGPGATAPAATTAAASVADCFLPLAQYCASSPWCPSYADSVQWVRSTTSCPVAGVAEVGTCGDLRYTRMGDGYTIRTLYYGPDDAVLAARVDSDAVSPNQQICRTWTYYGPQLDCVPTPQESYCPR